MGKPENNDAYERMLIANLQRALDFLKYAEAKNAALLTLSSAMTIALGNALLNVQLPKKMEFGLGCALVLAIAAGLIAISGFLPRLHLPEFMGGKTAGPHPKNLLYFGDIASHTIRELAPALIDRYGSTDIAQLKPAYLDDLLVQVWVNSQITSNKMRRFQAGAWIVALSAVVVGLTVLFAAISAVTWHV